MTAPSLPRRLRNTIAFSRRRARICSVDLTEDGFVLTVRKREQRMRWSDIVRIEAGIRDFLTSDELYVVLADGKRQIEVQEIDDGFRLFEVELFARWPSIRDPIERMQRGNLHEPHHEKLWTR